MAATTTTKLWGGDALFRERLTEFLLDPIGKADRFEEDAMPVRPLITVYGHHQSDKAQVVKAFCDEHAISARIVQVRLGFTRTAVEEMKRHLMEDVGALSVLILDHADVLLMEPEHADSQLFSLTLRDLALKESILLVGCFDRVLNARETESYGRCAIRPWMHAICYLAPPTSTWISVWLQHQLEGYVERHLNEGFELHLTRDEYTVVAQNCVGASYGHLVAWVRRIWYYAYQSGTRRLTKEWLQTPPLMSVRSGRLHILEEDVRADESKFSIAAGLGPVGAPASVPLQPMAAPVPKYMTTLDEPAEGGPKNDDAMAAVDDEAPFIRPPPPPQSSSGAVE